MKKIILLSAILFSLSILISCNSTDVSTEPEVIYHLDSSITAPFYEDESYSYNWTKRNRLKDNFVQQNEYNEFSVVSLTAEQELIERLNLDKYEIGKFYFYDNTDNYSIGVYRNNFNFTIILNNEVFTFKSDISFDPFDYCVDNNSIYLFSQDDTNLNIILYNIKDNSTEEFTFSNSILGEYPYNLGSRNFSVKDNYIYFYTTNYKNYHFIRLDLETEDLAKQITKIKLQNLPNGFFLLSDRIIVQNKLGSESSNEAFHMIFDAYDYNFNLVKKYQVHLDDLIRENPNGLRSILLSGINKDIMFNGKIYGILQGVNGYSYIYSVDLENQKLLNYKKIKGNLFDYNFKYNNFDLQAHINNTSE